MMETFDRLRSEVKNAIVAMPATLRFNIVIFAGDGLTMLSPAYVVSNDVGKRDAQDFLDRTAPHGASDPLQAVRAALAAAPDAIFLITDGDLPDGRRLLDEIRKGNAGKKICINTIVTAQSDDYDKLLRQIAEENGGGFSHLGG
jgi:CheY-like chemotaxis protein